MQKLNKSLESKIRQNRIIIDTNIIIYMYENKKDIFDFAKVVIPNAEFFILDKSIEELDKVFGINSLTLRKIKVYLNKLEQLNKFKYIIINDSLYNKYKTVDKLLIYFCRNYLIYTNDKILKEKIKKRNGKVLTLKLKGVFLN